MIFKLELFVLFCLINFHVISSNFEPELVHLLNSDYLLVNEYGIFQFKGNNFNQYEKILSLKEEQNPSVEMKNIKYYKIIYLLIFYNCYEFCKLINY